LRVVSVVVPARNEQEHLPSCLNSLWESATAAGVCLEMIVVLDCCTDATEEAAIHYTNKTHAVNFSCRSASRNYGASQAQGEQLVFVDADTTVESCFFEETLGLLDSGSDVVWYNQKPLEKSIFAEIFYFFWINILSNWRPTFSPAIAVNKSYFSNGNRFNEKLGSLEDIEYLNNAWLSGSAKLCSATVWTSIRRVKKFGVFSSIGHFICAIKDPYSYKWKIINE
jgi:glycosyltransferase involved in cell wall biosynthesis